MAVRNCKELGENLQKIVSRLMANDELVNLLYYADKDPLSHAALTSEQKKEEIFEKLIKIIPRVGPKEDAKSIIVVGVTQASQNMSNSEFKDVIIQIEVFTPLTQWIIKDSNLRPFAILGAIQESLNGKTINGLGKIKGGDFTLRYLTDEVSCHMQTFYITTYD